MLVLLFTLGSERYGIAALDVLEVLPMAQWRPLHGADASVVGLLDYCGRIVPILDLVQRITGVACASRVSSRVLLVEVDGHRIGLLAEHVTETLRIPEDRLQPTGVAGNELLGPVWLDAGGSTQLIRLERLLNEHLRALLVSA